MSATASVHCAECNHECDTVQHTLVQCLSFNIQRETLRDAIGQDLFVKSITGLFLKTKLKEEQYQTSAKKYFK